MASATADMSQQNSGTPSVVKEKEAGSPHKEKHAAHGELVRDAIIGFADGLTVPFALTAGLSSLGSAKLVILGGLAELFAGSLSMGLGAYLAAVTEAKHYEVEELRERAEVKEKPLAEEDEVYEIFEQYGIERFQSKGVVEGLKANEDMWVRFMMDFELKLEKPRTKMAWIEGIVMAVTYFFGGLLPMIPYFAFKNVTHALFTSIGITALILVVFGYVKALVTGCRHVDAVWSAAQTLLVGAVAAGASYGIVRGVNSAENVTAMTG
ncbi:Protein ccc1 [Friedmanniomyces endolithicus]|uniref:Protein ccc1 n=1 Tax=Rachicladosporium monterosium TaxID=1507873 RepID=A0ABR0KZL4_9PEZI|nr:Protein ccc1 [Friedmanniomyces endolithicus]KAK1081897.1 Protein ccc1 [Friedmanniomyces endolithicus]KAK1817187.1 Protein ccc1 [Friedmanniomyces endolithicus]KAK5141195.1 Protein ccc1 [Rachicladosporium monterosium]